MIYVNRKANRDSLDSDVYFEIESGGTVTLTQKSIDNEHNDMICVSPKDVPQLLNLLKELGKESNGIGNKT